MSQGHPYRPLDAFPTSTCRKRTKLWRIVGTEHADAPWWFRNDGDGRFDLQRSAGRGTCYFATTPLGCLLETVWRDAIPTGEPHVFPLVAPAELANLRAVTVELPSGKKCADVKGDGGVELHTSFGITDAIGTCDSYQRPQEWASAWDAHGFEGVAYRLAHGTGQFGWAFFGPAGRRDDRSTAVHVLGEAFLASEGLTSAISPTPSPEELDVISDANAGRSAIEDL